MAELELRDPLFLLLGLLAPLVYRLGVRTPASVTWSSLALVETQVARSVRSRLVRLPALLLALATLALAIALAGPRTGDASSSIRREGIAIAMIVDRSGSMRAVDFAENDASVSRLDAVKRVFRDFVLGAGGEGGAQGRPDDLIGLVGFARWAEGLCPLTLDHANLVAILDQLETVRDEGEDGTALGEGLALGVERLRRSPAATKVAVLLTDGVNNAGDISPLQAADLAVQQDVRVYAIGVGRTGVAPVRVESPGRGPVLKRAFVEMEEGVLQTIAARTRGRYFHAADADGLARVVEEIDRLERSELSELRHVEYRYHYAAPACAGLLLAGLAALLGASLLRRLP